MPRIDLRNKELSGKIQTNEFDLPGIKGTLPFDVGQVQAVNAEPGSPLPKAVMDEIEMFKSAEQIIPEHIKKNAVKLPPIVDIEELPAEKQDELLKAIKQYKAISSEKKKKPEPPVTPFMPRGPGIAEAKNIADKAAEFKAEPEKPEEKPAEVQVQENKDEKLLCKHCGWPVGESDLTDPTTADKQLFVASVLSQTRFTKTFKLLDGKFSVTFRALTTEENDLIIKQMVKDWNDGKISGPAHSVVEATKYQLALSIASVDTAVGPITLPELEDYDDDPPKDGSTILPGIVTYVQKNAMPNENMRRIISKAFGHFIDLQTKLEAMAETPDFWRATEA